MTDVVPFSIMSSVCGFHEASSPSIVIVLAPTPAEVSLVFVLAISTLYVTLRRLKAFLSGKDVDDAVVETE